MKAIVFAGCLALLATLLGTRLAILVLVKKGYGQLIRDDGPTSHHVKRGTPTMGGLVIIAAVLLAYFGSHLITFSPPSASALLVLFLFTGLGVVGFLDDYIKIRKQRSLGLRSKAKIAGQSIVAILFAVASLQFPDERGVTPASPAVSFLRDIEWLQLPLILVIIWVMLLDRCRQQWCQPHRRARWPRLRCLRHDLRCLYVGQHLAVQPVLCLYGLRWSKVLRGAGPLRPGGRSRCPRWCLLRLLVVER